MQANAKDESNTTNTNEPSTAADDKKAQVAAAIARAKAKKTAKAQNEAQLESADKQVEQTS